MRALLIAIVALIAATAASAQDIEQVQADGPYTQAASGMIFPTDIGAFHRNNIIRYSTTGDDMSARYFLETPQGRLNATIYVYPSPQIEAGASPEMRADGCEQVFAATQMEITSVHPHTTPLETGDTIVSQQGAEQRGRHAIYRITAPSAFGREHPPFKSELYVFCFVQTRWTVAYRFTYPEASDSADAVAAFMRDLPWTIGAS